MNKKKNLKVTGSLNKTTHKENFVRKTFLKTRKFLQ